MSHTFPAKVEKTFGDNNKYTIIVSSLQSNLRGQSKLLLNVAPLSLTSLQMPLEGEIVNIVSTASSGTTKLSPQESYYYTDTVSITNSIFSNFAKNSTTIEVSNNAGGNVPLSEASSGITTSRSNTSNTANDDGNNITPRNTPKLHPYDGDSIIQSRFGSSIRMTSTLDSNSISKYSLNPTWGKGKSFNSSPLLILSNSVTTDKVYRTENINQDTSVIMLTSGQAVGLQYSAISYLSGPILYGGTNKHIPIGETVSPEVLINSSRVVINSRDRDITVSAKQSFNVGANSRINLSSGVGIALEGPQIYLGFDREKHELLSEPAIKGEKMNIFMGKLFAILSSMCDVEPKLKKQGEDIRALYAEFINTFSRKVRIE